MARTNPFPQRLELRRKIRDALGVLPNGRSVPLSILVEMVNDLLPTPAVESQVEEALKWNHDQGFVSRFRNEELERFEWLITKMGRANMVQG